MASRSLPFLVRGTGTQPYPWKVSEVRSDQTLSDHKSLKTALRDAECANLVRLAMPDAVYAEHETYQARDVRGSCSLWYDLAWDQGNARPCDGIGSISDPETGLTWCNSCWRCNHA